MPASSVKDNNAINKKCGEITITMKKNAKNVYSFNCWFCDTIYIQMKKFSLHLETEHVNQLEESLSLNNDLKEPEDKPEIETAMGSLYTSEIKEEDCSIENIKIEYEEEEHHHIATRKSKKKDFSSKFQDPLETLEHLVEEDNNKTNTEEIEELKYSMKNNFENINEAELDDIDMQTLTDDDNPEDQSELSADDNDLYSDDKGDDSADEQTTKGVKTNSKTEDKEFILALIKAYEEKSQLWDTSQSDKCNLKQKEQLLQTVTDDLNTKFNQKLKLYMIKKKLNSICKQYEKAIEKQINCEENEKTEKMDPQLWYFENMHFLKSSVENKFKLKKRKPNLKVKPLNDNILCDLIDIYKTYNSLWDVNHLAFTVKDKRQETMQSMLEDIENKLNLSLDIYKLEKHLNYIHKSFAKDKQHKLECEIKQQDFLPTCPFYIKCEFLELHQGPFRCENCNEIVETYNDFQLHKFQHDGSIPFKCLECGMGFKKISNYTIHAKRHLRVFKFHCEICGKGYPFNAELDLHMRSHTGAQPYLCSVCGEGFRTAISYDNHIRRHEERFKYFCHICKKGFNHMTRLNDHVKAHLNVRDVICIVCGKGFTSRKYLNHHKRIHEGKNYNCNICGKSFAQDAGLRAHKKYHGTPIGVSSLQKEQNKYKT